MTWLIIFAVAALLLSVESVRLAVRDGRGPQRPPQSHHDDAQFRSPSLPR